MFILAMAAIAALIVLADYFWQFGWHIQVKHMVQHLLWFLVYFYVFVVAFVLYFQHQTNSSCGVVVYSFAFFWPLWALHIMPLLPDWILMPFMHFFQSFCSP